MASKPKPKSKGKTQSLALELVKSDKADIVKKPETAISSSSNFLRRLVHHPDSEIPNAMIVQQATYEADQQFGAELTKLRLDIEDIDAAYKISLKALNDLEAKLANTARYIKSGNFQSGSKKDATDIHWNDWRRKDQVLFCFLLTCLIIAAALGMGNVYANLVASGNAVFIEKPWLALMISALMPIASTSIKFVTNFMTYDSSRRTYAKCIYAATGIAFLFWCTLFGVIHTGVAGTIDWESFGEDKDYGSIFIWSQLLIEMLAASALFLALEDIYMRYSPDIYVENHEYLEIEKALEEQRAARCLYQRTDRGIYQPEGASYRHDEFPSLSKLTKGVDMKTKTLLLCVALFTWLTAAHAAAARDLIVALSPYHAPDDTRRHSVALLKQLTGLNQSGRVTLIDGYNLSIIGEFNFPDNPAYNNAKGRLGMNREAVTALKRFADRSVAPGSAGHPSVLGAVRLPKLLRYVANNFNHSELDIIVLGSPFYDDSREPAFTMANGRFPSDGHLFASQGKTPFGAAGQSGLLKNVRVYIGYGSDRITQGERHGYFIKRFWTLYVEALGGKLGGFVADVPTLFRGVKGNAAPPAHDFKPVRSDKLEMIILRPVKDRQSIFERPVSETALSQAQMVRAENVRIGISWVCVQCDLDVYARPLPDAPVLYFGCMVTAHGRYWKDYRNSPQPTNGYETSGFDVPLDLRTLACMTGELRRKRHKHETRYVNPGGLYENILGIGAATIRCKS